jgi:hypothetical protein
MFDNFISKIVPFMKYCGKLCEKYSRDGQAADNNMAHPHCMLGHQSLQNTFIISNNNI